MKTLKITLATTLLIVAGFLAKADHHTTVRADDKLSATFAIQAYIDAFSHGKPAELNNVLDKNVKWSLRRGNNILTYNKAEILQTAKNQEGVEQNCRTNYSVIENLPGQIIVKMNAEYSNFTRTNYLTMMQTAQGWKITSVSSVFS